MFKEMEIFESLLFLEESKEKALNMSEPSFLSAICMLLEEYAKAHKTDVKHYADSIHDCVYAVNEELGKF